MSLVMWIVLPLGFVLVSYVSIPLIVSLLLGVMSDTGTASVADDDTPSPIHRRALMDCRQMSPDDGDNNSRRDSTPGSVGGPGTPGGGRRLSERQRQSIAEKTHLLSGSEENSGGGDTPVGGVAASERQRRRRSTLLTENYEGSLVAGMREGHGRYVYSNGDIYVGMP